MAKDPFTRRNFIKTTAATTIGVSLASPTMAFHQDKHVKPVRVAVIGTGNRGTSLLRNLLAIDGVEIPALCDLNTDRLAFARKMCVEAGKKEPEVYSKDEYSYKELMDWENLDAVIIATGGASYPSTGSTGDGYRLAESVGHSVIPTRPSLVPLETPGSTAQSLQGLSLRNVSVSLLIDAKKKDAKFGEMLFTHFGLSGPIILSLSRQIVDALNKIKRVIISIDLKPALDDKKLKLRLLRDIEQHGKQRYSSLLRELLPRKLIPVCVKLTNIDGDKLANQISSNERIRLCRWLKDFRFDISGHRSYSEAIITAGGVCTKEVDPRTMESRLVNGLYFAGEVLDIDADTGGFNLQAAFSTGWLAGQSAAG